MASESDLNTTTMQRPEATPPVIAVVVPCYNEEDALPISLGRLGGDRYDGEAWHSFVGQFHSFVLTTVVATRRGM